MEINKWTSMQDLQDVDHLKVTLGANDDMVYRLDVFNGDDVSIFVRRLRDLANIMEKDNSPKPEDNMGNDCLTCGRISKCIGCINKENWIPIKSATGEDNMEKIYTREDECPFVRGEKIVVGNHENNVCCGIYRFYDFDKELDNPFLVSRYGNIEGNYKYAKKIRPNLEVDAKVWVRHRNATDWHERHFSHWNNDRIVCFRNGTTSHTTCNINGASFETSMIEFDSYTLTAPNKHDCCKE